MLIYRKINNNCALARDASGTELVVFGRGIGYHRIPYELRDLSVVERTFYGVRPALLKMLEEVPQELVLLSSHIADDAADELGIDLNPNLPFTLADHLNFAIERASRGLIVETPLANDVRHLYPREMEVARRALKLVRDRTGINLPAAEQTNVALHVINAEAQAVDLDSTRLAIMVTQDVTDIVEHDLGITIDTSSLDYSRFAMHLRYLIERMNGDASHDDKMVAPMLSVMRENYADSYACVEHITDYLRKSQGWDCGESETFYLLVHVQRLAGTVSQE